MDAGIHEEVAEFETVDAFSRPFIVIWFNKAKKEMQEYIKMAQDSDEVAGFDQQLDIQLDFAVRESLGESLK